MMKIAVVHYQPLAYYPPAFNFLEDLSSSKNKEVKVYTRKGAVNNFDFNFPGVTIEYLNENFDFSGGWKGSLTFFAFHISVFFKLLAFRPCKVLYFENLSAICVALYSVFAHRIGMYVHYHEYFEPPTVRKLPFTHKLSNLIEKKIVFEKVNWLSHTNSTRLKKYLGDNGLHNDPAIFKVFPNYPPGNWLNTSVALYKNEQIRLIYIGSLSVNSFYFIELIEWVIMNSEKVDLTIYSYQLSRDAIDFIKEKKVGNIFLFEEGVNYYNIPDVLKNFDIGLILYKPLNDNMRFNETNKLFEYLICGLDVMYPVEMELITMHKETFGDKLIPVDFLSLNKLRVEGLIQRHEQKSAYPRDFVKEVNSLKLIKALEN